MSLLLTTLTAYLLSSPFFPAATAVKHMKCHVVRKFDSERTYSPAHLRRYGFSIIVQETATSTVLSRCSYDSARKYGCDTYVIDQVEKDSHVDIVKYYYFSGQYDLQIFQHKHFVENNGRGGIAFGTCKIQ